MSAIVNRFWNCAGALQAALCEPPPRHAPQLHVVTDHATLPNDWNCSSCFTGKTEADIHVPEDPNTWILGHASSAAGVTHYECRNCASAWAEHHAAHPGTWSCIQNCGATGISRAALEALQPGAAPAPTWGQRIVQTFPEFRQRAFSASAIAESVASSILATFITYAFLFPVAALQPLSLLSFSLHVLPAGFAGAMLGTRGVRILAEAGAWVIDSATATLRCKLTVRVAIRVIALCALSVLAATWLAPLLAEKIGVPLILQAKDALAAAVLPGALERFARLASFFISFEIGAYYASIFRSWAAIANANDPVASRPIG